MVDSTTVKPSTKRDQILRDTLAFLSLIAITVVLFAITLLLFRSFMTHRVSLAHRWADRGHDALTQGQPLQAVAAYRAALSYAPGEHQYERLLAQALSDAGRTEEGYNYFLDLWETQPGDGALNLQLARLAARKHEVQEAINFYRASLYGTWEGDGVERRRAIRLELAQYLIAQRQLGAARAELLIAGGNTLDTPEMDLTLAKLLEQADAPQDALSFYRRALAINPKNSAALVRAGFLLYTSGNYPEAHKLLLQAAQKSQGLDVDSTLLADSGRILELSPALAHSTSERVARILSIREIAKKRLAACIVGIAEHQAVPESFASLHTRWTVADRQMDRKTMGHDEDQQNAAIQLVYDTELAANQPPCPPATGDDILLLRLAHSVKPEGATYP